MLIKGELMVLDKLNRKTKKLIDDEIKGVDNNKKTIIEIYDSIDSEFKQTIEGLKKIYWRAKWKK